MIYLVGKTRPAHVTDPAAPPVPADVPDVGARAANLRRRIAIARVRRRRYLRAAKRAARLRARYLAAVDRLRADLRTDQARD